jgi:hypothetical protein
MYTYRIFLSVLMPPSGFPVLARPMPCYPTALQRQELFVSLSLHSDNLTLLSSHVFGRRATTISKHMLLFGCRERKTLLYSVRVCAVRPFTVSPRSRSSGTKKNDKRHDMPHHAAAKKTVTIDLSYVRQTFLSYSTLIINCARVRATEENNPKN